MEHARWIPTPSGIVSGGWNYRDMASKRRTTPVVAGPLMQTPIFLVLFLAPVYLPLSLLTGWIHAVARVNPISYILEAARGFMAGDPVYVGLAFGLGILLVAVLLVWARRGLRSAEAAGA